MSNDALQANADVFRTADFEITTHGSDWYFTVCAIMTVSCLVVITTGLLKPASHRLFHYISAALLLVAAIAYFTMGSNLGQVPITAEFMRPGSSKGPRRGDPRDLLCAVHRLVHYHAIAPA